MEQEAAPITLRVNGGERTVHAAAETPLLWVLRDHLDLRGAKYGCGVGLCGACTVHVDGRAVPSCSLPVGSVGGRAVTTVEGLSPDGSHPVQAAWVEHSVPQCGYCQAGQVMAAAALLRERPDPTEAQILDALRGNVCRCGTYRRILAAVRTAGERASEGAGA